MQRHFLISKIHLAHLTATNLDYMGSISIDSILLEAAGIIEYEQVQIVNVNNGERLTTYAIAATPNSGSIELNGAAARLGMKGDRIIIMTYGILTPEEYENHTPKVIYLNQHNQII